MSRFCTAQMGATSTTPTARTRQGGGRSAASSASGGMRWATCARHNAGSHTSRRNTSAAHSTTPATTRRCTPTRTGAEPRRTSMRLSTSIAPASASATSTTRSRSHSVVRILPTAFTPLSWRGALLWYSNDCSHTRSMPHGNAVTTYTTTTSAAARTTSSTRRCESNSTRPAIPTAGTASALIEIAAPPARPTETASIVRGSLR